MDPDVIEIAGVLDCSVVPVQLLHPQVEVRVHSQIVRKSVSSLSGCGTRVRSTPEEPFSGNQDERVGAAYNHDEGTNIGPGQTAANQVFLSLVYSLRTIELREEMDDRNPIALFSRRKAHLVYTICAPYHDVSVDFGRYSERHAPFTVSISARRSSR